MINRYYEISCDFCGEADHYMGSIKNTELQYAKRGGIVINHRHFCSEECYKKYRQNNNHNCYGE